MGAVGMVIPANCPLVGGPLHGLTWERGSYVLYPGCDSVLICYVGLKMGFPYCAVADVEDTYDLPREAWGVAEYAGEPCRDHAVVERLRFVRIVP